jgi:ABC-type nitrate/sulfonate/bicarbonate transport system ATPase subunit
VQIVGDPGRLEVRIDRKVYRAAEGGFLEAVRGLAFTLEAGTFGALIGDSGCGKTTTLRIIAGLDRDFEGQIARPEDGRLGIVFQEPRLLPWRTVEQNVRLALPSDRREMDLSGLFALLGLSAHRDRYPGELSLGLARRAAMARAFAVGPKLLLLDEPFVSLDHETAARLRLELADMCARTGATTLLVTHDLDEAILLADRLFLLSTPPAHVVREVPITLPRSGRTEAAITRLRKEVEGLKRGRPQSEGAVA